VTAHREVINPKSARPDNIKQAAQHRATAAALRRMEAALQEIAKQKIYSEMDETSLQSADWEAGYQLAVGNARAALQPPTNQP
jgi:hypothetical protein